MNQKSFLKALRAIAVILIVFAAAVGIVETLIHLS
jgi:hypothetical protein